MQHLAQLGFTLAAPGQPDADHQGREFEQHQEDHHVALVVLAQVGQVGCAHGKGDDADRAIVRRHRGGIGPRQLAQALQHGKGDQRQDGADADDDQRRQEQFGQRLAGQLDAALQADGEEQEDAQRFVEHRRDLQVGTRQPGQQAEQEEKDDRFKRHGTHHSMSMARTIPAPTH